MIDGISNLMNASVKNNLNGCGSIMMFFLEWIYMVSTESTMKHYYLLYYFENTINGTSRMSRVQRNQILYYDII